MLRTGPRSNRPPSPARLVLGAVVALAVAALTAPPAPVAAQTPSDPPIVDLTFPTDPERTHYTDTFSAARSGGRQHNATDIMGEKLLPIYAAVGGVIDQYLTADDVYGYRLRIKGTDGRTYSYVHLNNDTPGTDDGRGGPEHAYAPGIAKGVTVQRGQLVAFMGDSGNAEGTAPHLHFSIVDTDGIVLNPYQSLLAAEARGDYAVDPGVRPPSTPAQPAGPIAGLQAPPSLTPVCPTALVPGGAFTDIAAASPHLTAVDCLAWRKVALGTGGGRYAPEANVSRLQMASFTARLLESAGVELPASPPDAFDDDAGSVHERAVNQLVALGVIAGDTGEIMAERDFEAEVDMKRDRMAAWMVRAYELISGTELPAASSATFTDQGSGHHSTEIGQLADLGVVQGTSAGRYEPRVGVRRDQMASYLARTLAAASTG